MIEIIFLLAGLISLFASFFLYTTLLEKGKIKPHIPARYMCSTMYSVETFMMQRLRSFISGMS